MFNSFKALSQNRTTYAIGMLQAKAYRTLKRATTEALAPHGVSSTEWAFLGLLFEKGTISPTLAAEDVGVEAPFITVTVRKLSKMGLVTEEKSKEDTRQKTLCLTKKGTLFVENVEKEIRPVFRALIKNVKPRSLLGYIEVLQSIVRSNQE